ncbi:trimeric LpxA-like protein [Lipomyces chichibuensis]|uniref:trimeric LpxA-like protein n=1 Tax=Lipomyces chichibuensis TaxID=1546026 RepID=UPI0033437091
MASSEKNEDFIAYAKTLKGIPWCEDYERMISGMLYNSFVPELVTERIRARQRVTKYNAYFPEDATAESITNERETMLRNIIGKLGKNPYIEPPFYVDYGCNISIGDDFYANFNTTFLDCSLVTIGDRVKFGPGVSIFSATHPTSIQSRRDGIEYAKSISIGSDCWIGGNVSILPGVTIGEGCTIGAGSVVTKDIPSFSVAIGSPARVVKKLEPVPELN